MRRRLFIAVPVLAILLVAIYWFGLRGSSTPSAEARPARAVAQIGNGKRVILVADDGRLLGAAPAKKSHLPVLPLKQRPHGDRVRGHVLEQVRVVGDAPKALRPYIAGTSLGKTGVDVALTSGIEIRFGDKSQAARKWKAAAAVLADPSVTLLSYVDVHAPTRPSVDGKERELPPLD